MQTYIAFLRGINVGGHKKIKMAELRGYLAELGYGEIKTYIQSGNIIFRTAKTGVAKLEKQIEQKINDVYGFEVKTFVKTPDQVQKALTENPIAETEENPPNRIFIIFIDQAPVPHLAKALKEIDIHPAGYFISKDVIYFNYPLSVANGKLSNNFFEQKLKVTGTARNIRTIRKILEMCGD